MNCGRSSSVEWKLPKLQRRVRFPSPALAPPGHAPGGFVMPTSHPPSMRRDNRRNTFPARAGARGSGTKLAQHARHATSPGTKLAPHAQNLPIWCVLLLLGEFYPVFIANKPSMASFLPHKHQHHHRHERNNTPTQHTKPRDERLSAHAPQTAPHNEIFIAPARHKQPKFTHFHHAGANFLSQHTPHTHARATFLSTNASASKRDPNKTFIIFDSVITSRPDRTDIANRGPVTTRRSSALDTAPMHQIAQHCTGN